MLNHPRLVKLEDYTQYVGAESVERILKKARPLRDLHVVNVNSTYYGGGVAELLGSMTILMNSIGIKTGWRVIQGSPDFFSITKKMHNALQGGEINLTDRKKEIYEEVVYENAIRTHLEHDVVIIHDPQPLPIGPLISADRGHWPGTKRFYGQWDGIIKVRRNFSKKKVAGVSAERHRWWGRGGPLIPGFN